MAPNLTNKTNKISKNIKLEKKIKKNGIILILNLKTQKTRIRNKIKQF